MALDDDSRLRVVRKMFSIRFGEEAPAKRSVDQLRGIEGVRVRETYKLIAQRYGVQWTARRYDPGAWATADVPNQCLSQATSCLYGLCEAAVLAAGYAPAVGFLHTGKPQSFVYDVADLFKFETVVPVAFQVAGDALHGHGSESVGHMSDVRRRCRDSFRRTRLLERIIPTIEEVLAAGGLSIPEPPADAQPVAFQEESCGDAGHRG